MYLDFYKLDKKPFQISADPLFLWMGEKHKEALAMLKYGVMDNRGFIMLTGDVGTGKTTLINALKNSLGPNVVVANISDPGLEKMEFFNCLAAAFGFGGNYAGKNEFIIALREFLERCAGSNKQALLIIDEAQRLSQEMLEEIRVLSNIERQDRKLLNIFFVGQDELNDTLARHENRALRQRMTLQYHLEPLTEVEIGEFIRHRLKVAGTEEKIFSKRAVREIHAFSGGYPRLTNIICDHAMLAGYVNHKATIDAAEIRDCAEDLRLPAKKPTGNRSGTRHTGAKNAGATPTRNHSPLMSVCAVILLLVLFLAGFVYFPIRAGASYSDIFDYWINRGEISEDTSLIPVDSPEPTEKKYKIKQAATSRATRPSSDTPIISPLQPPSAKLGPPGSPAVQDSEKRYDLTFEPDSNDLSPEDYRKLDKTVTIMQARADIGLTVRGYSDGTGSKAFNDMLSKLRADIVKNYLVSKGVDPGRIVATGIGVEDPVEEGEDSLKRRVEVEMGRF